MDAQQQELIGSLPFTFDAARHIYRCQDGERAPSITQMLKATGHVDDAFYTEEGRRRGQAVHDYTLNYDLGAATIDGVEDGYRGYFLNYVAAVRVIRPNWINLEVGRVHPRFRFAGKPDRDGTVYGCISVLEIKTGGKAKWHDLQTALQAILVAPGYALPPETIRRYVLYLEPRTYKLEECLDRRDFFKAREIIRQCCGR